MIEGEVVGAGQDDVLTVRVDGVDQLVLPFLPCLIHVGVRGEERQKEREREKMQLDYGAAINDLTSLSSGRRCCSLSLYVAMVIGMKLGNGLT